MSNTLNELSKVYKKKIDIKLLQGDSVDGGDAAKPGKDKNYVKPMATEGCDDPDEKLKTDRDGYRVPKKDADDAKVRILTKAKAKRESMKEDHCKVCKDDPCECTPEEKKVESRKIKKEDTYSSWREGFQFLDEVSVSGGTNAGVDGENNLENPKAKKDTKSNEKITEKKVKNKILINPPQGVTEGFAELGGQIVEMYEIVEGCGEKDKDKEKEVKKRQMAADQRDQLQKQGKVPTSRAVDEAVYGGEEGEKAEKLKKIKAKMNLPAGKGFQGKYDQHGREYDTNTGKLKEGSALAGVISTLRSKNGIKSVTAKDAVKNQEKKEVEEGYDTKKREEVIKALKKKKEEFKKRYGKDAPDVMYAVAAKTAKKKGDTSKSDDKYAYEEVVLEGDRPKNAYPANLRAKTMMMNKKDRQKHFDAYDKSNPVKKSVTKEEVVDKALDNVIGNIRKSGGVMASDLPKATDKQKAEWKAEKARRAAQKKSTGNPYKPRQGESD